MTNHTIEANFEVRDDMGVGQPDPIAVRHEAAIQMLATAMAGERPSFREAMDARRFAPMLYRGVMALPEILQKVHGK
jgi:hypothetical protein